MSERTDSPVEDDEPDEIVDSHHKSDSHSDIDEKDPADGSAVYSLNDRKHYLKVFIECFNCCYPDWEIAGENRPLEPGHVEYRTLPYNSNLAWCGQRFPYAGRIYFGLNHDWATRASPAEYLALVIHELAHVEYDHHGPTFWEQVVEVYRRLEAHSEAIEDVLTVLDEDAVRDEALWNRVIEHVVTDPINESVDNRSETAYDRRLALAEALDYDGTIAPFAGLDVYQTGVYIDDGIPRDAERVRIEEVNFDLRSVAAVRKWLRSRSPEGVQLGNSFEMANGRTTLPGKHYLVDAVPVVPLENESTAQSESESESESYRVVEGDERLSLVYYAVLDDDHRHVYTYAV